MKGQCSENKHKQHAKKCAILTHTYASTRRDPFHLLTWRSCDHERNYARFPATMKAAPMLRHQYINLEAVAAGGLCFQVKSTSITLYMSYSMPEMASGQGFSGCNVPHNGLLRAVITRELFPIAVSGSSEVEVA